MFNSYRNTREEKSLLEGDACVVWQRSEPDEITQLAVKATGLKWKAGAGSDMKR